MRLRKYERDDSHAYTFGVFPTLELLQHQSDNVSEVLLHSAGVRNEGISKIKAICQQLGIRISVDDKLVERLESKENTYAIGVFEKYDVELKPEANHVLLVNPSDMGNLGTTLRTLLGFGCRDLAIIKPAVDIFDPRTIRASMGGLFQVNFAYFDSIENYQESFTHNLYPFMTNGAVQLPNAVFTPPYTLVFGSESSGLPDSYRKLGTSVTIPQTKAIDSLNLSVAIGIALYGAAQGKVL